MKIKGFLILGVFALIAACASQQSSGDRNPSNAVTAAHFCESLKANDPRPGQSLRHVRETMTALGLINQGVSLGARASNAAGAFANAGFVNSMAGYEQLLDRPNEIVNGSVFLMRRSSDCTRVHPNSGHVAVQCDGKMILVQRGYPEVSHETYKKCVYSVQRHLAWSFESSSDEPEGDDIEGQQAHP